MVAVSDTQSGQGKFDGSMKNRVALNADPRYIAPHYGVRRRTTEKFGRVAQRESTSLTSKGSQVQSLSRPPLLR